MGRRDEPKGYLSKLPKPRSCGGFKYGSHYWMICGRCDRPGEVIGWDVKSGERPPRCDYCGGPLLWKKEIYPNGRPLRNPVGADEEARILGGGWF